MICLKCLEHPKFFILGIQIQYKIDIAHSNPYFLLYEEKRKCSTDQTTKPDITPATAVAKSRIGCRQRSSQNVIFDISEFYRVESRSLQINFRNSKKWVWDCVCLPQGLFLMTNRSGNWANSGRPPPPPPLQTNQIKFDSLFCLNTNWPARTVVTNHLFSPPLLFTRESSWNVFGKSTKRGRPVLHVRHFC